MFALKFRREIHPVLQIASPLIAALLAQKGLEILNMAMLGRLGSKPLAAAALAEAVLFSLLVLCIGILNASGILMARFHGAGQKSEITHTLNQGIYLALFLSIPCMILLWMLPESLLWIGEDPTIVVMTRQFLHALVWGIIPLMVFFALREFISALAQTKIVMLLSLSVIPLTAVGNYLLIYGKFGFPALGIAGVGYSTALMQWVALGGMLTYIFRNRILRPYFNFHHGVALHWSRLKEILHLGWPIGITIFLEVGLFAIATLMMGFFGGDALAAHQIVLQWASLAFMFMMGVAQATGVRVGQAMGARKPIAANHAGQAGLYLGTLIAIGFGIPFLLIPRLFIGFFVDIHHTGHEWVVIYAEHFLRINVVFIFFDAVQVIMNGALRGLKDTFVPMWLGLLSYWIVGVTSSYLLGFTLHMGGVGLWWGLAAGTSASAVLLWWRFCKRIKHELHFNNTLPS